MLEYDTDEISIAEIKERYSENSDIEFVSYANYDSKCNLCSGTLTLMIKGKKITFGINGKFSKFFSPAECISDTSYERKNVNSKGWNVDIKELPLEYRPYAKQIHDLLNQHMPKDFCVGCD